MNQDLVGRSTHSAIRESAPTNTTHTIIDIL